MTPYKIFTFFCKPCWLEYHVNFQSAQSLCMRKPFFEYCIEWNTVWPCNYLHTCHIAGTLYLKASLSSLKYFRLKIILFMCSLSYCENLVMYIIFHKMYSSKIIQLWLFCDHHHKIFFYFRGGKAFFWHILNITKQT